MRAVSSTIGLFAVFLFQSVLCVFLTETQTRSFFEALLISADESAPLVVPAILLPYRSRFEKSHVLLRKFFLLYDAENLFSKIFRHSELPFVFDESEFVQVAYEWKLNRFLYYHRELFDKINAFLDLAKSLRPPPMEEIFEPLFNEFFVARLENLRSLMRPLDAAMQKLSARFHANVLLLALDVIQETHIKKDVFMDAFGRVKNAMRALGSSVMTHTNVLMERILKPLGDTYGATTKEILDEVAVAGSLLATSGDPLELLVVERISKYLEFNLSILPK